MIINYSQSCSREKVRRKEKGPFHLEEERSEKKSSIMRALCKEMFVRWCSCYLPGHMLRRRKLKGDKKQVCFCTLCNLPPRMLHRHPESTQKLNFWVWL